MFSKFSNSEANKVNKQNCKNKVYFKPQFFVSIREKSRDFKR